MNTENQWLEITLQSDNDAQTERFEQALEAAGAIAITYQAADDEEIYEPPIGSMPLWRQTGVTGLFAQSSDPEAVIAALQQALGDEADALDMRQFADSEWTRAWLDHFRPIDFGRGFWVAASEHEIPDANATVLRLDPGLAFGTGTHPSTAMCLNWLNQNDLHGKSVYDYGCGSGILGIAAALLGAREVWQTDIDPQALTASLDNAQKNGVDGRIHIVADPAEAPRVDVLVANILLEPLCFLQSQFLRHIHPDTRLVFAGVLERQVPELAAVYQDAFDLRVADTRDGWALIELSLATHPKP
ncbi:MAG: 50S ribosomal protein L11 methyltransferase [Cardiobacteriaceae bacterium]|nr:50S ribosomal protein L11 methyltransferase [Cardiobacteriaceae bacterium]